MSGSKPQDMPKMAPNPTFTGPRPLALMRWNFVFRIIFLGLMLGGQTF